MFHEWSQYMLRSVAVHRGGPASGHFVAYRRGPDAKFGENADCWYYASDNHVRRATLEEVLASQAYMLFYERVEQTIHSTQ